jgi:hypothetical protein
MIWSRNAPDLYPIPIQSLDIYPFTLCTVLLASRPTPLGSYLYLTDIAILSSRFLEDELCSYLCEGILTPTPVTGSWSRRLVSELVYAFLWRCVQILLWTFFWYLCIKFPVSKACMIYMSAHLYFFCGHFLFSLCTRPATG